MRSRLLMQGILRWRRWRASLLALGMLVSAVNLRAQEPTDRVQDSIDQGLRYLTANQARGGQWVADGGLYPVAMTALAGMAILLDGNTAIEGPYAKSVQAAISYLVSQSQPNGLIGDPRRDSRYMYGHGFSMLFLSEVLGEEEDLTRRQQLIDVLGRAVEFAAQAQTEAGGWGYVSAKDGKDFDEGSVTVTQMQGLRACLNAGIDVPKNVIEKGIRYIERCTEPDGGVRYSLKTRGGARPPITAAAIVCLFNAGEYDNPLVGRLTAYADRTLGPATTTPSFGHWHYAQYYYAQVIYRKSDDDWQRYADKIHRVIVDQQARDGSWRDGSVGPVYTTALNLTILQLDNGYLPIYQR